jgi:threonine dehydrogenase-like Zn-dependent dehydrogenase
VKIAILGAGNVGQAVGARLVGAGHAVTLSFAREAQALADAAARIGAHAAEPEAAVAGAEAVLLATPWGVTLDLVRRLAPALDGKLLWDTTNCLKPDFSGLEVGLDTSGGEAVAAAAPGARAAGSWQRWGSTPSRPGRCAMPATPSPSACCWSSSPMWKAWGPASAARCCARPGRAGPSATLAMRDRARFSPRRTCR